MVWPGHNTENGHGVVWTRRAPYLVPFPHTFKLFVQFRYISLVRDIWKMRAHFLPRNKFYFEAFSTVFGSIQLSRLWGWLIDWYVVQSGDSMWYRCLECLLGCGCHLSSISTPDRCWSFCLEIKIYFEAKLHAFKNWGYLEIEPNETNQILTD